MLAQSDVVKISANVAADCTDEELEKLTETVSRELDIAQDLMRDYLSAHLPHGLEIISSR